MGWDPANIAGEIAKNTVGKLVDALAGRFLQSETDRQKFELEKSRLLNDFELETMKVLQQQEASFRDSVNAYENPAGLSRWMLNFRASVRPVITYEAAILLNYIIIFGGKIDWENINKIPTQVWAIFLVIFGFWFGGRAWADVKNGKNG